MSMKDKKRVIIVTDGDKIAREAVEIAAKKNGCRCISSSAGNPTPLSGQQIVDFIYTTPYDPVVVMVDDRGAAGKGQGERVMEYIIKHPHIEVIGVVAVASNTENIQGANVDCVITKDKEVMRGEVNKEGIPISDKAVIKGDTVDILNQFYEKIPLIVGVGDIGKMEDCDKTEYGAQITSKALGLILDKYREGSINLGLENRNT